MRVYAYPEARQNLAALLDAAQRDGTVRIRRRDGRSNVVQPAPDARSPLDVEGVDLNLTTYEIVTLVREGRERQGRCKLLDDTATRVRDLAFSHPGLGAGSLMTRPLVH